MAREDAQPVNRAANPARDASLLMGRFMVMSQNLFKNPREAN